MVLEEVIKELGIQKKTFSDAIGFTRQGLLLRLDNNDVENAWGFKEKQKAIIRALFQVKEFSEITPDYISTNKSDIKERIKMFKKIVDVERTLDIISLDINKTRVFYKMTNIIKNLLEEDDYFLEYNNTAIIETSFQLLQSLRGKFGESKYLLNFIGKSLLTIDKDTYPDNEDEEKYFKYFEATLFKAFENYRQDNASYSKNDLNDFMKLIEDNLEYTMKIKKEGKEISKIVEHILNRTDLTDMEKNNLIKIEIKKIESCEVDN